MLRKIKLNSEENNFLSLFCDKNLRGFVYQNTNNHVKYFYSLPSYILGYFDSSQETIILIYLEENEDVLNLYIKDFLKWLKSLNKPIKRKLTLNGLGYRCLLSDSKTELLIKIGFSHNVTISIPKNIFSVVIQKNIIIFEGFDAMKMGLFCRKLKDLRKLDPYKHKGFVYPGVEMIKKTIKKK